jgi:hypothetical protein
MVENEVLIDDLYSFAMTRITEIQQPANVHFTKEGSALLAKHVAASIQAALHARSP